MLNDTAPGRKIRRWSLKNLNVTYPKIQKLHSHLPVGPEELKTEIREDICKPTLLATLLTLSRRQTQAWSTTDKLTRHVACTPTTESPFASEGRKHQDSLQQKERGGHWGGANWTTIRFYFERNATELPDVNSIQEAVVGWVQLSLPLRCPLSSPLMGKWGDH